MKPSLAAKLEKGGGGEGVVCFFFEEQFSNLQTAARTLWSLSAGWLYSSGPREDPHEAGVSTCKCLPPKGGGYKKWV